MTNSKLSYEQWYDSCQKAYSKNNSSHSKINKLLVKEGAMIVNDHIAFRTLDHASAGIKAQADYLTRFGYEIKGEYKFTEKKLRGIHLENKIDVTRPKIFLSELITSKLPNTCQKYIEKFNEQYLDGLVNEELFYKGAPESALIAHKDYKSIYNHSEYLAWLLCHGLTPNHFTLSVNDLTGFGNLLLLNNFLKEKGFELNQSGGEIKGCAMDLLEQSSTLADMVDYKFSDITTQIPGCYYEFALRYPVKEGNLFQGFVTKSADKIFESTN